MSIKKEKNAGEIYIKFRTSATTRKLVRKKKKKKHRMAHPVLDKALPKITTVHTEIATEQRFPPVIFQSLRTMQ